jgi:Ser/Thr protein kinase RdoA (MazF antagonist)
MAAKNDFFPVAYSVPSGPALQEDVLTTYTIEPVISCKLFHMGLNDSYLVQAVSNNYILRVYRAGWRSLSDILFEIDMVNHLKAKGIPAAAPIAKKDGSFLTALNTPEAERYVVLFPYAPGKGLQRPPAPEQYYLYGTTLAQMHTAWDDFTSQHTRFQMDLDFFIDSPVQAFSSFLSERPTDAAYVLGLAHQLKKRVLNLPLEALDFGICHGDPHGGNAHIAEDQVITFFDFDNGGPCWRTYDLASFRWSVAWNQADEAIWEAFLRGYRDHRSLAEVNMQAVPLFALVRHLYIVGMQAGHADEWGSSFINETYIDKHIKFLQSCEALWLR